VLSEQNDIFARYCESNGSLKSSSAQLDLTIPVKAIKLGFSGNQAQAKQEMQKFCNSYSERLNTYSASYQLNNRVVVDALLSFNQCVALEGKRVQISHVTTNADLVVRVGFNPAEQQVTLNSVQYDPAVATCTSNIAGEGKPIPVSATTGELKANKPFSIACGRKALTTARGDRKFARLEVLVDTNQGAYTVAMPTEEMLGFDLASTNRQAILAAKQEQTRLRREVDSLKAKIAGVRGQAFSFTQGQGQIIPCPQDGGNILTFSKNYCDQKGATVSGLQNIGSRNGGKCGYTSYKWACISFP